MSSAQAPRRFRRFRLLLALVALLSAAAAVKLEIDGAASGIASGLAGFEGADLGAGAVDRTLTADQLRTRASMKALAQSEATTERRAHEAAIAFTALAGALAICALAPWRARAQ